MPPGVDDSGFCGQPLGQGDFDAEVDECQQVVEQVGLDKQDGASGHRDGVWLGGGGEYLGNLGSG